MLRARRWRQGDSRGFVGSDGWFARLSMADRDGKLKN